jgi:hypothetical protein
MRAPGPSVFLSSGPWDREAKKVYAQFRYSVLEEETIFFERLNWRYCGEAAMTPTLEPNGVEPSKLWETVLFRPIMTYGNR